MRLCGLAAELGRYTPNSGRGMLKPTPRKLPTIDEARRRQSGAFAGFWERLAQDPKLLYERQRAEVGIVAGLLVIVVMCAWAALTPHAWQTGLGPLALIVGAGAGWWLYVRVRRQCDDE